MRLSKKAIKEFKEIYQNKFDKKIDDATAQKLAIRFLNLFKAIYNQSTKK